MNKVINFKSVESAVYRLSCGRKTGSAFLISSDKEKSILLTAEHTLSESNHAPIQVELETGQILEASILRRIPAKDIAVLTLTPALDVIPLPISGELIAIGSKWESYGFPAERIASGAKFTGTVSRTNQGTKWDIDLDCDQYNNLNDFAGISGAPLLIDGMVVGVIGFDIAGGLGASGLSDIGELIAEHGIEVQMPRLGNIPASIEEDLPDIDTTNSEVIEKILETVSSRPDTSYFLVSGNPGAGKTTIAAQLDFEENNKVVCDRYFVKVPEREDIPTQIRAKPEYFMRWIEEVYSRILFNRPPDRPVEDEKPFEHFLKVKRGLEMLGQYYLNQDKTGFLIIDGLDDVEPVLIEDFLSVLPLPLPPGLKIIFSCTSKVVLSSSLQALIEELDEISVTPLSFEKANRYLQEQLDSMGIPQSKISELAFKSEGHPLYLRYLAKYVLGMKDISGLEDWIGTIPSIQGEIERYYIKIWQQIVIDKNEMWMAGTLSRLRIPVSEEELYPMLSVSTQESFPIAINTIRHLLKEDPKLSIYHTSFSDFVRGRTASISKNIHDNIAGYCRKEQDSFLTICELVYHLAKGSDRELALEACNQTWVDKCAIFSLGPDLVLSDIRRVISLAAKKGTAHKVIDLLLLSQRVNFRYNILFDENATFLVNALLALGKYDEALRYVVRNNALVVSDGDALYLLQRFYEYGAVEQAKRLLTAIKATCTSIFEKGFDSESFSRYTRLRFSAISISSNEGFENAFGEFEHLKRIVLEMLRKSGNSEDVIHQFKDEIGAYNIGYFIWRFNVPPVTKQVEEQLRHKHNGKSSGFTALCIYQALNFQEISPIEKAEDNLPLWVEDLEYLIDKYGIHPAYHVFALYVLIRFSKRKDIIQSIFDIHFKEAPVIDFRKQNGVDHNRKAIDEFSLYSECCGYLNVDLPFPKVKSYGYSSWEQGLASRFEAICFLSGRCRRIRHDAGENIAELPLTIMNEFLSTLNPDLRQRMDWERSYGLPEAIYPILYDKITDVLTDFFPTLIEAFIDQLQHKKRYQLGVYTEGYMDILMNILRRFAKLVDHHEDAFRVAKVLENHVRATVENRWEKNEYLLRLVQYYAHIDNLDKANAVFKEMIDYSMGPSWYKEAQLGIANTAVARILPEGSDRSYVQKIAAHLDHASGEMTFQRYVKQQQESLVGDLAKVGLIDEAIAYFKYLILPDYSTIINNAESGLIDMPYLGAGYVLGSRAIEEQSAILDLLSGSEVGTSQSAFVLAELFMLGDDRYLSRLIRIQADILNSSSSLSEEQLDVFIARIIRFYITELDEQFRNDYLLAFAAKLKSGVLLRVATAFKEAGISTQLLEPPAEKEENVKSSNEILDILPGIQKQVIAKLRSENKSAARKLIVDGLSQVQQKRYSVWSSNYANEINELRDLLAMSYTSPVELVQDIHDLLMNEVYNEEWTIADKLIDILKNISDQEEKKKILDAVEYHISLMVRTPEATVKKYDFLASTTQLDEDFEKKLLRLMIWFLGHPSICLKNRTMEALVWVGKQDTIRVLECLIEEILSQQTSLAGELSAAVLHQIAVAAPVKFYTSFKMLLDKFGEKLLAVKHFMIQNSILEAISYTEQATAQEFSGWKQHFEAVFKGIGKNGGDVEFDEDHLSLLEDELIELGELGVLNRDFAVEFKELVEDQFGNSMDECIRADRYIDRSFNNYNDVQLVSDFESRQRHALNTAIFQQISLSNRQAVADILRFYQPTFPENLLSHKKPALKDPEKWVKILFSQESNAWQKMIDEDEIILGYFSKSYSQKKRGYHELEIRSYLIPIANFPSEEYYFPFPSFRSNRIPVMDVGRKDEEIVELVFSSDHSSKFPGSDLVPAVVNDVFFSSLNLQPEHEPTTSYWRNGRNWELKRQGAVQQSGYSITIPGGFLEIIQKKYKLIWEIDYEYETIILDVNERRILE